MYVVADDKFFVALLTRVSFYMLQFYECGVQRKQARHGPRHLSQLVFTVMKTSSLKFIIANTRLSPLSKELFFALHNVVSNCNLHR